MKIPNKPFFFGIHVGTKEAATSRYNNKLQKVAIKLTGRVINWDKEVGRQERGFQNPRGIYDDICDVLNIDTQRRAKVYSSIPSYIVDRKQHFIGYTHELMKLGVSAIKYINYSEHIGSTSMIILDRRNIKLAGPVLHYKDGSIIPLSKRF